MIDVGLAAGFAALAWWFTTGIILFLDGLPPRTFRWSMTAATGVLAAGLFGLRSSSGDTSVAGAYTAFTCAVLIWAWLEMSFLMGFVTGCRSSACPIACGGWRHFLHATQAIIYNELATLVAGSLVLALTWDASNKVGRWTFLVLWTMRLSAKLNLFFGVPNTGEKFLPPHLQYLRSFFKKRKMNFLFPISISLSTMMVVKLVRLCLAAPEGFAVIAYTLVTSLLALAVLEHWFMVLPWEPERIWAWGFSSRPAAKAHSEF